MATPTPQAVASNDNGNANTTTGSVLCPTVLDGDGIALVVTSSRGSGGLAGNAPSLPSGSLSVRGGGASGDTTASGTCTTQVWTRDNLVAATDSGATISLAFLSGRYSVAVLTYRGGTFDQCTAVNQTGTGANPADAGTTPGAADCLRMIISGYDPASGVSTTLTPPASPGTWTEQIEHENTASTTFRPGGYIATTPLTGQNGTPQSAATITASTKPNANTYALTIKPPTLNPGAGLSAGTSSTAGAGLTAQPGAGTTPGASGSSGAGMQATAGAGTSAGATATAGAGMAAMAAAGRSAGSSGASGAGVPGLVGAGAAAAVSGSAGSAMAQAAGASRADGVSTTSGAGGGIYAAAGQAAAQSGGIGSALISAVGAGLTAAVSALFGAAQKALPLVEFLGYHEAPDTVITYTEAPDITYDESDESVTYQEVST